MLSNLPLFHAFGLTVTTCLPLLEGIPMVCHPDPTDAVGSAKAIARIAPRCCAARPPSCACMCATARCTR
jgi:acyl-CoA synthetase (AMP-forming)/AMP-acid ligase II